MKTLYVIQVQDGDESRELCNCMEYSPSEVGFVGSFAHLEEEHAELKNQVCEAIERLLAKPALESVLVGCSKENWAEYAQKLALEDVQVREMSLLQLQTELM